MLPDAFRELDKVAHECFAFLVDEQGAKEPYVEYWRDFFLVYELPDAIRVRVGMERGWLVPFVDIEYRHAGQVLFPLQKVLRQLHISVDSTEFPFCEQMTASVPSAANIGFHSSNESVVRREWPKFLAEYAKLLSVHYADIAHFARTRGRRQAQRAQSDSEPPRGVGTVLRTAKGESVTVIGAGWHFWQQAFVPISRSEFWKIIDKIDDGYAVSYATAKCPSCERVGNVGVKPTLASQLVAAVKSVSLVLFAVSVVAFVGFEAWHASEYMLPLTGVLAALWLSSRFGEHVVPMVDNLCPRCGHRSKDFPVLDTPWLCCPECGLDEHTVATPALISNTLPQLKGKEDSIAILKLGQDNYSWMIVKWTNGGYQIECTAGSIGQIYRTDCPATLEKAVFALKDFLAGGTNWRRRLSAECARLPLKHRIGFIMGAEAKSLLRISAGISLSAAGFWMTHLSGSWPNLGWPLAVMGIADACLEFRGLLVRTGVLGKPPHKTDNAKLPAWQTPPIGGQTHDSLASVEGHSADEQLTSPPLTGLADGAAASEDDERSPRTRQPSLWRDAGDQSQDPQF